MQDVEFEEDAPAYAPKPSWRSHCRSLTYILKNKAHQVASSVLGVGVTNDLVLMGTDIVSKIYSYVEYAIPLVYDRIILSRLYGPHVKITSAYLSVEAVHNKQQCQIYGVFDSRFSRYDYSIVSSRTREDLRVIPGNIFTYSEPVIIYFNGQHKQFSELSFAVWDDILRTFFQNGKTNLT